MGKRRELHGVDDERRSDEQDGSIPPHEAIDSETEAQLFDLAGFSRADLYERRGPMTRRGLAWFLEPGDRILEVRSDHALVQRRDGSRQTYWNLRRNPSWVRVVTTAQGDEGAQGELAPAERG